MILIFYSNHAYCRSDGNQNRAIADPMLDAGVCPGNRPRELCEG
jgi:hypothetical protein